MNEFIRRGIKGIFRPGATLPGRSAGRAVKTLLLAVMIAAAGSGALILNPDMADRLLTQLSLSGAAPDRESWTLAFYLAGDNSLERDQVKNLREICAGSPAVAGAPIVVFADRDDDLARDSILSAWKGTRLFLVTEEDYLKVIRKPVSVDIPLSVDVDRFERAILGRLQDQEDRAFLSGCYTRQGSRYILKERGSEIRERIRALLDRQAGYLLPLRGGHVNLDATDAGTLSRFVHFVKDNFPSDRVLLCITGHGNGWFAGETPPPSDNRSAEYAKNFEIASLRQALAENPVDVLVLDMCSMGDIETAWELRQCARHLVGNQTAIPAMGLDYTMLLKRLGQRAAWTPRDMAHDVVEAYRDTYGDSRQFAISATALDLGEDFHAFVHSFHQAVGDSGRLSIMRKAAREARFIPGRHRDRYPMVDLLPLVSALGDPELDSLVLEKRFVVNHAAINSSLSGISLYLPSSTQCRQQHQESYARTSFARDFPHGWVSVLPGISADH